MIPEDEPRAMTTDDDAILKSLVDNAFDFLQRSTRELEKHPKYSLIHFCAAVELFVKARLMREHWSLIVMKPESAKWASFCNGDFKSVGLEEADDRLRNIAGDGLSMEERSCFGELAKHRNKLIHFQHPRQSNISDLRAQVAAQQLRAWFYLHRILSERWSEHFKKIASRLRRMESAMRRKQEYLGPKFGALKQEMEEAARQGERYVRCPWCGFDALHLAKSLGELSWGTCRICEWPSTQLEVTCPDCKANVIFQNGGEGTCPGCGRDFEPKNLVEILVDDDEASLAIRDGDDSMAIGNCSFCGSTGTLIPFNDQYLCVSCLALSEDHWPCNWCGEYTNVRLGYSAVEGCFDCSDSREEWMDRN